MKKHAPRQGRRAGKKWHFTLTNNRFILDTITIIAAIFMCRKSLPPLQYLHFLKDMKMYSERENLEAVALEADLEAAAIERKEENKEVIIKDETTHHVSLLI